MMLFCSSDKQINKRSSPIHHSSLRDAKQWFDCLLWPELRPSVFLLLSNELVYCLITTCNTLLPVPPLQFQENMLAKVDVWSFYTEHLILKMFCIITGQQDQPGGSGWQRESRLHRSQRDQTEGERRKMFFREMNKCMNRWTVLYKTHLYLQEGANINKSLTTLGKVISALAEVVCFFTLHKIIIFRNYYCIVSN